MPIARKGVEALERADEEPSLEGQFCQCARHPLQQLSQTTVHPRQRSCAHIHRGNDCSYCKLPRVKPTPRTQRWTPSKSLGQADGAHTPWADLDDLGRELAKLRAKIHMCDSLLLGYRRPEARSWELTQQQEDRALALTQQQENVVVTPNTPAQRPSSLPCSPLAGFFDIQIDLPRSFLSIAKQLDFK